MKTIKQLLITIAVLLCSTTMYAYDFEVDGIYYNIIPTTDFTAEVTSGDINYSGDVIIPSTVNYNGNVYSVKYIESSAFESCSVLTSIEIPNSITSIGSEAFSSCSSLTNVIFEENSQLTSIDFAAFKNCSSLASIEIPNSVTSIKGNRPHYGAFCGCSSLTNVIFEENSQLTSIGGYAFQDCSSLTSIEIPNSVTSIEGGAFENCSSLTSIEIPNSVTSIEYGTFERCYSLTSIEIPNSVTSIEGGAFENCSSLTSIEIPNSVTSIKGGAFENCSSLTNVIFGENPQLTTIGHATFMGCSSLTSIEIPNSVTSIETCAFKGCSSLTSIEIPNSVTVIGGALNGGAFENCSSLTSIEIPNSITYIETCAFKGCTSLEDLHIEDGYATLELGDYMFENCPLETIYLGRNISYDNSEDSENLPFHNMITLKMLTIGGSVTKILEKTFYDCSNLESIYVTVSVPPMIADNTFSNANYYVTNVYVPKGTLAFYQSAYIWRNFQNIQEYEPTAIEDIDVNIPNFTITSNGISLSNANNSTVAIYSINGVLVKKIDKYTGEEITLENGVYIVCVGDKAMKIIL